MYAPPRLVMPFLLVISLLWEPVVRARNSLYNRGILSTRRLKSPVISIGNLTLGGTGKTPLVIYVAELVGRLGRTPALLTRGYKRRRSSSVLILPPHAVAARPAVDLGDEPALVRIHVPAIWLGISPDRFRAGKSIEEVLSQAVVILDDGFQHRRLERNLDIVVVDPTQPLAANRVFPSGSLREPVGALTRCHAVVINGDPREDGSLEIRRVIDRVKPEGPVFHCIQQIRSLEPLRGEIRIGIDSAGEGDPVFLVAAVGNPLRFRRDVERLRLEVRGCRFFRDHHTLSPDDWKSCWVEARSRGAKCILTTEKDVIRLDHKPDFPLFVAVQSTHIVEAELFENLIRSCIEDCRVKSQSG